MLGYTCKSRLIFRNTPQNKEAEDYQYSSG